MWSPKPSLIYSCQLLLILKHLAFVNDIKRLLSTVGKTTVQENIAHLWCWFLKASRRHFYKYLSWRYSAKNSGATMSTEGRFNSSLSKSSGCSWETKAGTHSSGEQWRWWTKAAQCTFPGQVDNTWSPTRAEKPSLWQSPSSCSLMVVSGAIIIVVEPWKDVFQ